MVSTKGSSLVKLVEKLKGKLSLGENVTYSIPEMWDSFDYAGDEKKSVAAGVISVNPYRFYSECIEKSILPSYNAANIYSESLAKIRGEVPSKKEEYIGGDWIAGSSVYGMQIRTTTSWDHDRSGELELNNKDGFKDTGTFMKTIALLPMLKKMGIDAIYMLPVSENSTKFAKGEMGSPYAVKNFFKLDPNLKDPMLGDDFSVDDEFRAFVEACHIMGIRVMIDIIPRTNARNSDIIIDHPEWFYWVKIEELESYGPPIVDGIAPGTSPMVSHCEAIYSSSSVAKHLEKFCASPDKLDPEKWADIQKRYAADSTFDFFEAIEKEYGITTAPAFSDCINDVQPPWTDVTFLKLYLDHPMEAQKYLKDPEAQTPYILFDIIKSNNFPGAVKNQELWELIADVIPHYQREFGIDGARIDMGHALPSELEEMILSKPRQLDPEFCFIAEELSNNSDVKARKGGYNMIIGEGWYMEPRIGEGKFHEMLEVLPGLKAPVFACAETPDTPRAASRKGEKKFSKLVAVLNNFLPNGVPFLSSGFEIYEKQPLNTGLDSLPDGRFTLPEDDPFYGKLGFFDRYALHWTNEGNNEVPSILSEIAKIRSQYISTILDANNYLPVSFTDSNATGIGTAFIIDGKVGSAKGNLLLVLANTDFDNAKEIGIDLSYIREKSGNNAREAELLYSEFKDENTKITSFSADGNLTLGFEAGEIKIIVL